MTAQAAQDSAIRRSMWLVVPLLGGLYIAEGIPSGFVNHALPVLMRKQGYSLADIGFSYLLSLPWALKFLWAPLVDQYGSARFGHRRSWIIPLQITSALLLITLGLLGAGEDFSLLLGVVFVVNLLTATQDIATDALAVDLLDPKARGISNGVQSAGYRIGMFIGGGLLMIFYDDLGFRGTFVCMGVLLLMTLLPVLVTREPKRTTTPDQAPSLLFDSSHFLRQTNVWRILAIIIIYRLGEALAVGMFGPFLADQGMTIEELGWLAGTVGTWCSIGGALLGGVLMNPLGRKQALFVFGILQAFTMLSFAVMARQPMPDHVVYIICGAQQLVSGMTLTAMFTMMMDTCRPGSNATDFTVQTSALMLANTAASSVSGVSAEALGYFGHFLLAATLSVVAAAAVLLLYKAPAPKAQDGSRTLPDAPI